MSDQGKKGGGVSRREFFKSGLALGLGAAAGAVLPGASPALAQSVQPSGTMPRRTFGRSGSQVSVLSLGGMFDILNNRLLLAKALDWGINYWDTAEGYGGGRSEEGIGRWLAKNQGTRQEIFLASKLKFKSGEEPTARLEESLKRLRTDHMDVLFMHGVSGSKELEPHLAAWAEAQKKAGKIRLFGFTTHGNMENCLEAAAKLPWVDAIMFTYNYRLMKEPRMNAAVEACAKAGIGLTAMKTMGGGQVKSDSDLELKLAGRFMQKGFTDYQAKLLAIWEDKRISSVCSQMPNLTILAANTAAATGQVSLSRTDREMLGQYAVATCGDYCAGCGEICSQALGGDLAVSEVMRALMYYNAYQDPALARATFAGLPGQTGELLASLNFASAERACPRGLPIGRLMQEAASLLA